MIGLTSNDGERAIKLLDDQKSGKVMRESHSREGCNVIGPCQELWGNAQSAADDHPDLGNAMVL